eukprot:TRINITY_DN13885_c0_g2_i1.p1 TRINITY_DN13885_c0_g2~~TRINITY_DN13885_c0_g2_i1.p1  ORF type:complete len:710 (+),score=224.49 TRINITY_DN13885_c0_g2_i1:156-2285(+)
MPTPSTPRALPARGTPAPPLLSGLRALGVMDTPIRRGSVGQALSRCPSSSGRPTMPAGWVAWATARTSTDERQDTPRGASATHRPCAQHPDQSTVKVTAGSRSMTPQPDRDDRDHPTPAPAVPRPTTAHRPRRGTLGGQARVARQAERKESVRVGCDQVGRDEHAGRAHIFSQQRCSLRGAISVFNSRHARRAIVCAVMSVGAIVLVERPDEATSEAWRRRAANRAARGMRRGSMNRGASPPPRRCIAAPPVAPVPPPLISTPHSAATPDTPAASASTPHTPAAAGPGRRASADGKGAAARAGSDERRPSADSEQPSPSTVLGSVPPEDSSNLETAVSGGGSEHGSVPTVAAVSPPAVLMSEQASASAGDSATPSPDCTPQASPKSSPKRTGRLGFCLPPQSERFGTPPPPRQQQQQQAAYRRSRSASHTPQVGDKQGRDRRRGSSATPSTRATQVHVSNFEQWRYAVAGALAARIKQAAEEEGDGDAAAPHLVPLPPGDSERGLVESAFTEDGLSRGEVLPRLVSVEKIVHSRRQAREFTACAGEDTSQLPCRATFHGLTSTPTDALVQSVAEFGLDAKRCKSAMFGKGAYVAAGGQKALMYATSARWDRKKALEGGGSAVVHDLPLKVVVLLLAPGDFKKGDKGVEHDCVTTDSTKAPTQFCIPEGQGRRLLPTHIITLRPAASAAQRSDSPTLERRGSRYGDRHHR